MLEYNIVINVGGDVFMICNNCNTNNNDGAKYCVSCGKELEPQVVVQNQQNMGNNIESPKYNATSSIIAIIVSVLCCTGLIGSVFAILSLVEGSKVKNFVQQGNLQAANASLEQAKKWNKISWIIIAVFGVISLLLIIVNVIIAVISNID